MKAKDMSNSQLIDYLYEEIEDFNDFVSREDLNFSFDTSLLLKMLEELVQKHKEQKNG